ncbi:MAG: hypothetical protein D6B27_03150 [Gammaproteobacteria bacterium]|nr:MAG: hypothetical protein D6B27_03150 [Gammaproteobacteria bacterium]
MSIRSLIVLVFSAAMVFSCSDKGDSAKVNGKEKAEKTEQKTEAKQQQEKKIAEEPKKQAEKTKPVDVAKSAEKTEEKTTTTEVAEVKKGTLMFFMNPNGGPCIAQDKIINSIADKLEKKVDIVYMKTTDPMSRMAYNSYGVRMLPSIIILDTNGDVYKTFNPGIQSEEALLSGVDF